MPPRNSPQTPDIRSDNGPFLESTHAHNRPLDGRISGPDIMDQLPPLANQGHSAGADPTKSVVGIGRRGPHGGQI